MEWGRGALHVTGQVSGYSGFLIWFTRCTDLSAYAGISFMLSGAVGAAGIYVNTLDFMLPTNSTFPWQTVENTSRQLGGCTAVDASNPWSSCVFPSLNIAVPAPPTVVEVRWVDMIGGLPTQWDARFSPRELMGIQWQFPWSSSFAPYAVDVMVDDIRFIGGADDVPCAAGGCTAGRGGTGGEGGELLGGVSGVLEGGVSGI